MRKTPRSMRRGAARCAPLAVLAASLAAPIAAPEPSRAAAPPEWGALTLADVVRLAAAQSGNARAAGFSEESAAARAREERAVLLPRVTATASQANRTFNPESMGLRIPGQSGVIGPFDTFDARLHVAQALVDRSGWSRWKAAVFARDAASSDRADAEEESAAGAARASLRLVRASAAVAAREADLRLAEELHALAATRFDAGTTAEIDVTRARAQVVASRGEVVEARQEESLARVALCRALGVDPGTPIALRDSLDAAFAATDVPGSLEEAIARAVDRRPDLAAARAERAAAERSLQAARAQWVPKLELVADAGWSGERPGEAETTRQLAAQLSWPLTDGFAREARIAARRAEMKGAGVAAEEAGAQIDADVRRAWSDLETGRTLEGVAAERASLAEEEVAQARLRLEEGLGGNLDVIEAQASLVSARDAVIDARTRSALARIELARALGAARELQ